MEFSYGQGEYCEGEKRFAGTVILSEHKLFLKSANGDIPATYIPLEKIERLRRSKQGLEVYVRPSLYFRYAAFFKGEPKHIAELTIDLVKRRGLKKHFLKKEWSEGGH